MKELYAALLNAKQNIKPPAKNAKAMYGRYADLDSVLTAVEAPLAAEGLLLTHSGVIIDGSPVVRTTLVHVPTAQSIHCDIPMVAKDPNDPQKLGGSITYARRYGITALLSIVADDDDDGNTAAGKARDGNPKPQEQAKSQPKAAAQPIAAAGKPGRLPDNVINAVNNAIAESGFSDPLAKSSELTGRRVTDIGSLTLDEARNIVRQLRQTH
jgi:hypothetical protein